MKKIVILFAVLVAVGCSEDSVEEDYCPVEEIFNKSWDVQVQKDGLDREDKVFFKMGSNFVAIDSVFIHSGDSTFFRNRGVYTGSFKKHEFSGIFKDSNNTEHSIYLNIFGASCAFKGEFAEKNTNGGVIKTSFITRGYLN